MILLLSGEGRKDIGQSSRGGSCWGDEFQPGPMARLIEQLLEPCLGYELIGEIAEYGRELVYFLDETDLAQKTKQLGKTSKPLLFVLKSPLGTSLFRKIALALGIFAKELEKENNDRVLAVIFRDADKTNSCSPTLWRERFVSIEQGFKRAAFEGGVAMVPKPKSEAWLLCALRHNYQHCDFLENESGNDDSPNSLKKQLSAHLDGKDSREELNELIEEGEIVAREIKMQSFLAFLESLKSAANYNGLNVSSLP